MITLLTAALMAASLPTASVADGPTCQGGLCAEFRLTDTAMYAYGSFDQPADSYNELTVTLYAFTKGGSRPEPLTSAQANGLGRLEATTPGDSGGYLAVFACAEIPPRDPWDTEFKVCDS